MYKNASLLVALEQLKEMETRRRLLAQARKGNEKAQKRLWQLYRVRLIPGKAIAPELVMRWQARIDRPCPTP
ncbi:hypothetical protein [Candidatus Nitrospira bockiana]